MKVFKLKKADIIVIAVVLVCAAVSFLCINLFAQGGNIARVEVDGKTVAELRLDTDTTYEIKQNGKVTNVLEIKDGCADMTSADCPDKICVNHRAISKSGESIICLPNKVIVTIYSGDDSEVDGVAG
ncbi:MAG: NusG domain II-containing protein [Eubacterium sp.]|nr:NusG domain II-containing protein [Eubacterium sp.]